MSLHLEGLVRIRESFSIHSVSHLVSMVSYMYVTLVTTEFRYSSFVLLTLFTIMIMTLSVTSTTCVSKKEVTVECHCIPIYIFGWPYIVYHTALQLL